MRFTKGLAIGQVFIYVLVVLTFGVILIFGYKSITGFIQRGEEVQFYQFKTDLESSIRRIYTEYGSVRQSTFHVPARFTQICFVDVTKDPDPDLKTKNPGEDRLIDPLAFDVWATVAADAGKPDVNGNLPDSYDVASENVFLVLPAPEKIKVHKISIRHDDDYNKNYLCIPIKDGKFTLIMEGKGDGTELSAG